MAPKAPVKPEPAAKNETAEVPEDPPPKKKTRALLFLVVAVVLLGGGGAGGWFFVVPRYFAHAKAEPETPPEEPVHETVSLGSIVVNVTSAQSRRYVKVGVSLGVPSEAVAKEVEKHKPELLDLLVTVLSTAELETLESGTGRTELKDELLSRIKDEVGLTRVVRVYFTEFLIQ